jgi:hypothetical protein
VVASLVLATDCHVGTKLNAAAALAGPVALGVAAAGGVTSLAFLAREGSRLLPLCILSTMGLGLMSVIRCGDPSRPKLWIDGLIAALNYGLIILVAQSVTSLQGSIAVVWNLVSGAAATGQGRLLARHTGRPRRPLVDASAGRIKHVGGCSRQLQGCWPRRQAGDRAAQGGAPPACLPACCRRWWGTFC